MLLVRARRARLEVSDCLARWRAVEAVLGVLGLGAIVVGFGPP